MTDHYVKVINTNTRRMEHPRTCTRDCEYNRVVLDGSTFSGMEPGRYRMVGFDPDSFHPFFAPSWQ